MTDLSPLIEKIEAAEEGCLDLSRAVHEAADLRVPWFAIGRLSYTTSIDAIVGLIERELPGTDWALWSAGAARLSVPGHRVAYLSAAKSQSPALALCSAFLKAIQAERREG